MNTILRGAIKIGLRGHLLIKSVVDEEFGGVNGTLAGRLRGFNVDAAIIGEVSGLRMCPAQRGGRIAQITFSAPGDTFGHAQPGCGAVEQLRRFLQALPDFEAIRNREAPLHVMYRHLQKRARVRHIDLDRLLGHVGPDRDSVPVPRRTVLAARARRGAGCRRTRFLRTAAHDFSGSAASGVSDPLVRNRPTL
jgi:hypothetical protein